MRQTAKKIAAILAAASLLALLLTGCGFPGTQEAETLTGQVIEALEDRDAEQMSRLTHPDYPRTPDQIEDFFQVLEENEAMPQGDISSLKFQSISTTFSSAFNGTRITAEMTAQIGDHSYGMQLIAQSVPGGEQFAVAEFLIARRYVQTTEEQLSPAQAGIDQIVMYQKNASCLWS